MKIVVLIHIILSFGYGNIHSIKEKKKACNHDNTQACYTLGLSYEKGEGVRQIVEKIKIYYFKNHNGTKPITLEYSLNGYARYYKYIFCSDKKEEARWYGIEDDGGGFHLKDDCLIYVENALRVVGDTSDDKMLIYLHQNNKKYLKGKPFECPKQLPFANGTVDDTYDNTHDGIKDVVKEALERSNVSKPNSEFIDNPKGLYYGCFRSITSCKSKNKIYFGRYATPL